VRETRSADSLDPRKAITAASGNPNYPAHSGSSCRRSMAVWSRRWTTATAVISRPRPPLSQSRRLPRLPQPD